MAGGSAASLPALVELLRPAQWVKNGFVLAPLLFGGRLNDPAAVLWSLAAFACVCAAASGVYCLNDVMDWRSDLNHPEKRTRPIPSGRVSARAALAICVTLLVAGIGGSFRIHLAVGAMVSSYVLLNILYSMRLKHVSIVDIMIIAVGFVLRVLVGASAIQVTPSHWLLMCGFLLALFLGVGKRRQELVSLGGNGTRHRRVLDEYSVSWLDQAATMLAGATLVSYALYTVAPETQARFHTDALIYTIPFVVFGLLRYLKIVHSSDAAGNPSAALVKDKHLLFCVAGWAAACALVIYL